MRAAVRKNYWVSSLSVKISPSVQMHMSHWLIILMTHLFTIVHPYEGQVYVDSKMSWKRRSRGGSSVLCSRALPSSLVVLPSEHGRSSEATAVNLIFSHGTQSLLDPRACSTVPWWLAATFFLHLLSWSFLRAFVTPELCHHLRASRLLEWGGLGLLFTSMLFPFIVEYSWHDLWFLVSSFGVGDGLVVGAKWLWHADKFRGSVSQPVWSHVFFLTISCCLLSSRDKDGNKFPTDSCVRGWGRR